MVEIKSASEVRRAAGGIGKKKGSKDHKGATLPGGIWMTSLLQQSHDAMAEELRKKKEELQKMITMNAKLQTELDTVRRAVREARKALGAV